LVVVFMLAVSALVTHMVLARLIDAQKRHLSELSEAFLDGLSAAVLSHVLREDVWEIYDALERASERYQGLQVAWTVVADPKGITLASSQPRRFPTQSLLPSGIVQVLPGDAEVELHVDRRVARLKRELRHQGRLVAIIVAEARIGKLIDERRDVAQTLILTNAALTILFAAAAYLLIRRMLRPINILTHHMVEGAVGHVEAIALTHLHPAHGEIGRLFRQYNSLVAAVKEREQLLSRLAGEERLSALGKLASGMAHEINNPLGGMLNAIDAIKRHGDREDVRRTSVRLLEQGLIGIRDVVRSALAVYRYDNGARALRLEDLDDIKILLQPELRRRRLKLEWFTHLTGAPMVPVGKVRGAALNLLLNACAASPEGASVTFRAEADSDALQIMVCDEGAGLPEHVQQFLASSPAESTQPCDHGGLGLWMVKRLAHDTHGSIVAEPRAPRGTTIRVVIPARRLEDEAACHFQVASSD
jgi:signal transduction histidine kinase